MTTTLEKRWCKFSSNDAKKIRDVALILDSKGVNCHIVKDDPEWPTTIFAKWYYKDFDAVIERVGVRRI